MRDAETTYGGVASTGAGEVACDAATVSDAATGNAAPSDATPGDVPATSDTATSNEAPGILLFGGTCETHALIERLLELGRRLTVSVASSYGRTLLPPDSERFCVLSGPMLPDAIEERLRSGAYACVVDATHPYASSVSAHVAEAAQKASVPYLRLKRDKSDISGCMLANDAHDAARLLEGIPGNVLLTTGSKDLPAYTDLPQFEERIYPRMLPTAESVGRAIELGYRVDHIIAMQGPFSTELNVAIMRQHDIAVMVTKDGGAQGGTAQKLAAAQQAGAQVIVVKRPQDMPGLEMEELLRQASSILA